MLLNDEKGRKHAKTRRLEEGQDIYPRHGSRNLQNTVYMVLKAVWISSLT